MISSRSYGGYVIATQESLPKNIETKVRQCLTIHMIHEMIRAPYTFSGAFKEFLVNMYCVAIGVNNIKCYFYRGSICEPIIFHKSVPNKNSGNNSIVHIFNETLVYNLFTGIIGSLTRSVVRLNNPELKMSIITTFNASLREEDCTEKRELPPLVEEKLLRLVTVADHGAWHYINYRDISKNGGKKFNILDHDNDLKRFTLAGLITSTPNRLVQHITYECNDPNLLVKSRLAGSDNDSESGDGDSSCGGVDEDDDEDEEPFVKKRIAFK